MDFIVKKASSFSAEEKTNLGITGIPSEWPVESYMYVDTIPDGFVLLTEAELNELKSNNQAAYDAWLYALRPLPAAPAPLEVITQSDKNDPKDSDGAIIYRPKAAKTGWTFHMTAPEFTTSTVSSLYHKNVSGTDLNECTVKFYDSDNVELTVQGDCDISCVKTVFTFEPTWDYEIIGGTIKTVGQVTEDVRIWVVAVPDISAAYGGSKVMIQGVNLKYVDPNNGIEANGRVSKFLAYNATYHTNKLQLTIKHPAGHKESIMIAFEVYKA